MLNFASSGVVPPLLPPAGDSFLSLSADIEAAYREYLANYSNVTLWEDEYKQKEALWNDIVRVVKTSACVALSFVFVDFSRHQSVAVYL